jgi:serine protease Do
MSNENYPHVPNEYDRWRPAADTSPGASWPAADAPGSFDVAGPAVQAVAPAGPAGAPAGPALPPASSVADPTVADGSLWDFPRPSAVAIDERPAATPDPTNPFSSTPVASNPFSVAPPNPGPPAPPSVSPSPSATWGQVPPTPPTGPSLFTTTPPATPKRQWAKPALVGGLIGSLLSGAVSVGAVVATRSNTKTTPATIAPTTPIVKTSGSKKPTVDFGAEANPLKGALKQVAPSVVAIVTEAVTPNGGGLFGNGSETTEAAGSGVIVSADGLVLTNAHVIAGARTITVTLADKSTKPATLVGSDPDNDVALVRITGAKDLPAATLAESAQTEVGDQVFAVGNALALDGGPSVTSGIVSALNRDISDQQVQLRGLIQTDAAINPGNSGGPLVNLSGAVIGMNTAIIQNSNNIGFAIPIDRIKPMLTELKSFNGGVRPRTFLGVKTLTLKGVSEAERKANGITATKGVAVDSVSNGSPAENAGLQPADVIISFDGKPVEESQQLVELVRAKKPDDQVKIEWRRGDQTMSATVKLGAARRPTN